MATQMIKMHLHGSKENSSWYAENNNLVFSNEDARTTFLYALYEVAFDVEVDLDTGNTRIITVDNRLVND